ncbi:hypothetical protein U9M48_014703 [Paspalum notatum var. saurae]|uniref:F-box domain-containing protein n=1 Tax=Paspalum notatum var. saurae TaxID=547442 RepID=A0AAQ3WKR7_PASNO
MDSEETKKIKTDELTINFLPSVLIEQIFLRLPVSTLLRCIEVCKQWHKIIRDPQFVTAHLEQASPCALLFFPKESVQGELYPSDAIILDETWSQSTLAVPVIGPDDILCGSCNGLICLYTRTSTIKIANLATGECLHLDKPVKNLKGDHFSFYHFGFHPVTKEYKVVHFLGEHKKKSQGTFDVIQVYTLGSDKWKDVRTSEALSLSCVKDSGVVDVDGTMFWLTEDAEASWKHSIISFGLSEETFARIQLPEDALGGYRRYWITEIDGKVCIATAEVYKHQPRMLADKMQIWTLDSKVEPRWSQMYSLRCAYNYYLPRPHFVHWDNIMVQDVFGNLYSYELFGHEAKLSNRVKQLNFSPHKPDNVQAYICVKSLVRLDAYKKVGIVHGSKQRDGWALKKWEAWERQICDAEKSWKDVYKLEQDSLAFPQHLAMLVKRALNCLPDEVIRQRITMEIDQALQHLPDCQDQASKQATDVICSAFSEVRKHLRASMEADDLQRLLIDLLNRLEGLSNSAANNSHDIVAVPEANASHE